MEAIAGYGSSDSEGEDNSNNQHYRSSSVISTAAVNMDQREPKMDNTRGRSMETVRIHEQQLPLHHEEKNSVKQRIIGAYVSKRKRSSSAPNVEPSPRSTESPPDHIGYLLKNGVGDSASKRSRVGSGLPRNSERLSQEHCKPVVSLDWHDNNGALLSSYSLDGTAKIWNTLQNRVIQTSSPHGGAAISCGQWVTHNTIATGGYNNNLAISDVENNKVLFSFDHKDFVSALQVNPYDRNVVFSGDYGSNVFSWDLRSRKMIRHYKGAGGRILDLAILQSGKELLASADIVRKNAGSQALRVWEIDSGASMSQQIYPEPYTCPCLRVHPYRNEFYAQSNANYIVIFSSRAPYKCNKRKRFETHTVDGNKVQFDVSPDGTLLCSASADGQVVLYNCETSRRIKTLHVTGSCCVSVAWNPHASSVIAVSDWDHNIHILK